MGDVLLFSSKCSVISCAILNKSKKIEVPDGSETMCWKLFP